MSSLMFVRHLDRLIFNRIVIRSYKCIQQKFWTSWRQEYWYLHFETEIKFDDILIQTESSCQ